MFPCLGREGGFEVRTAIWKIMAVGSIVLAAGSPFAMAAGGTKISATSNAALDALAVARGWSGAGTAPSPYVVTDCDIVTADSANAIYLRSTTRHVVFSGCKISGPKEAAFFYEASNIRLVDVDVGDGDITFLYGTGFSFERGVAGHVQVFAEDAIVIRDVTARRGFELHSDGGLLEDSASLGETLLNRDYSGVVLQGRGFEARGNLMVGNADDALWLPGCDDCYVHDNEIVGVGGSYVGVQLYGADRVLIESNHIHGFTDASLYYMPSGVEFSWWGTGNVVRGNIIEGNEIGVSLGGESAGNVIASNRIVDNSWAGIDIFDITSALVYDNWIENERNVRVTDYGGVAGTNPNATVTWFVDPTPGTNIVGGSVLGGNWWSDYVGADVDGDTLGEVPHYPVLRLHADALDSHFGGTGVGVPDSLDPLDLHPLVAP